MKRLFNIIAAIAIILGFTACEDPNTPADNNATLEIIANQTTISADGTDSVTFTVMADGTDVTNESHIVNLNTNDYLEGNTFTTTEAGTYRFTAIWGTVTAQPIVITATPVNEKPTPDVPNIVELVADKATVIADGVDVVTFSVFADDVDVTDNAEIVHVIDNNPITGNTYSTTVAGTVTLKAVYQGVESNEVVITAIEKEQPAEKSLTLTASTLRIKADGNDSVTFTVMYGEDEVSSDCVIKSVKTGETLSNNSFTTTDAGSYEFRAEYDGKSSNTITIDAYDPSVSTKYEPGTIYNENGVKGVVYAIKEDNHGDTWCYVMSMDEEDLQWSKEYVFCNCCSGRGDYNTSDPFDMYGRDINDYPAFKWCIEHGEGWFMPSSTELRWMWDTITDGTHDFNSPKVAEYNKLLTDNGGEPFCETYYWSSNEISEDMAELVAFLKNSVVCLTFKKDSVFSVRAVYRFKL